MNVTIKWGWKFRLRLRLVVPILEKSMRIWNINVKAEISGHLGKVGVQEQARAHLLSVYVSLSDADLEAVSSEQQQQQPVHADLPIVFSQ